MITSGAFDGDRVRPAPSAGWCRPASIVCSVDDLDAGVLGAVLERLEVQVAELAVHGEQATLAPSGNCLLRCSLDVDLASVLYGDQPARGPRVAPRRRPTREPVRPMSCGKHSSFSVSRTARLLGVPMMPVNRLTSPRRSASRPRPASASALYWSSSMFELELVPGSELVLVGVGDVLLEALGDRRERGGGDATGQRHDEPILIVSSIGSLATSGSAQSSVLTAQPSAGAGRRWLRAASVPSGASVVAGGSPRSSPVRRSSWRRAPRCLRSGGVSLGCRRRRRRTRRRSALRRQRTPTGVSVGSNHSVLPFISCRGRRHRLGVGVTSRRRAGPTGVGYDDHELAAESLEQADDPVRRDEHRRR